MKSLSLKTRLVVVTAFLSLYAVAASLSYWIRSRADAELALSFERDLAVLGKLPRLQGRLRELDLLTDQYLLTGNARWLEERQKTLGQIRVSQADVARLLPETGPERAIAVELDRQLKSHLVQQNQWIEQRRSGSMAPADAAKIASRQRPFDRLVELLVSMRDVNVAELERRRMAALRASNYNFMLILTAGLAATALLAFFLARYIIQPVTALEARARSWELGKPWVAEPLTASPEIESLYGCVQDMAGRLNRQFEKEAELNRLKTQLVSVMSHEFNNALSVIHGVTALLQDTEGEAPPEKRKQYYDMLKANVRSLAMEASTILHMGRLESGKLALKPGRCDLAAIIRESCARLRILSERKEHQVALELPDTPLPARADSEAMSLVVTNLLTNAIKYTPEKGRITLKVAPDGDSVRVSVRDTGIGIPPEDREKIFSGYYRTKESVSAAKGFGVGLSLASKIVQGHGSRLEVDSEPGKGSEFRFVLPLWTEDGGQEAA